MPVSNHEHEQADRVLDDKLRDLLAGIENETVSDELRGLAAQLQAMLDEQKALNEAKA